MRSLLKLTLALALLAALGIGVLYLLRGSSFTIELTRDDIQKKLDDKFPIEQHSTLLGIRLANPQVLLTDGADRIGLELDITVTVLAIGVGDQELFKGIAVSGNAAVTGNLWYDASEGAIYLVRPKLESFTVEGLEEKHARRARPLVEKALADRLKETPIYRVTEDDLEGQATKATLRSVSVRDGKVVAQLVVD